MTRHTSGIKIKPTPISHYKSNGVREFRVKPFIVEFIRIAYRAGDQPVAAQRPFKFYTRSALMRSIQMEVTIMGAFIPLLLVIKEQLKRQCANREPPRPHARFTFDFD